MKSITLVFDKSAHSLYNSTESRLVSLINKLEKDLKKVGLVFVSKDITELRSADDNPIFVFELCKVAFKTCVLDLSLYCKQKLRKNKIPILLFFDSEGFDFESMDFWLDNIQYQFTNVDLQQNQKFLCFGTHNMQNFYDKHLEKFKNQQNIVDLNLKLYGIEFFKSSYESKMTKVFGSNFFEYQYNYPNGQWFEQIRHSLLSPEGKTKNFICLNRNLRFHRLALVSEIFRNGLYQDSVTSLTGSPIMPGPNEGDIVKVNQVFIDESQRNYFFDFIKKFKPLHIPDDNNILWIPPKEFYIDTYFSLITETEISDKTLFITEKTAKALTWMHPFIILGNPYSLRYLKSLGYQTFPEIFDESYDEEVCFRNRFSMILQETIKFCKLSKEEKQSKFLSVIDKLQHNRGHYLERQNKIYMQMSTMFTDIISANDL